MAKNSKNLKKNKEIHRGDDSEPEYDKEFLPNKKNGNKTKRTPKQLVYKPKKPKTNLNKDNQSRELENYLANIDELSVLTNLPKVNENQMNKSDESSKKKTSDPLKENDQNKGDDAKGVNEKDPDNVIVRYDHQPPTSSSIVSLNHGQILEAIQTINKNQTMLVELNKKHLELENNYEQMKEKNIKLESELNELKENHLKLELNLNELKDKSVAPITKPIHIDGSRISLYQGSLLKTTNRRLFEALQSRTISAFTLKIFTSCFKVENVYRTTLTGFSKQKAKKTFLKEFVDDLVMAAKTHVPVSKTETESNIRKEVRNAITTKLSNLNLLFKHMIDDDMEVNAETLKISKLNDYDLIDFVDFEAYKNDLTLFQHLDEKIIRLKKPELVDDLSEEYNDLNN